MISYQEFKENYISRKNADLDLHVLTDMAIENDDPSFVFIPVLKKLRSFYKYIAALLGSMPIRNFYTHYDMRQHYQEPSVFDGERTEIDKRYLSRSASQYTLNRILQIPFARNNITNQEGLDSNNPTLIVVKFLEQLVVRLSLTYEYIESIISKIEKIASHKMHFIDKIQMTILHIKSFTELCDSNLKYCKNVISDENINNINEIYNFMTNLSKCLNILKNAFEKHSPEGFYKDKLPIDFDYGKPKQ